jgi:hypothetical protein
MRISSSMCMRIWLIALSVSIVQVLGGMVSAGLAQEPTPVKREILALYDGAQEADPDSTRIHRLAEMPLNHLGFILRFHDIRDKLPRPDEIERYRGVLTWFAGSVSRGDAYIAWASRVSGMDVHYVILGDIGVAINSTNIGAVNQLLAGAGVRHIGEYITPTLGTRVAQEDRSLVEFECRLGPVMPDYPVIVAHGAATRVGLMLETPSYDGRRKSILVAVGDKGGYAALNYEFCHQRAPLYQGQWLINPFAFFRAAFASDDQPILDTTTASGSRMYFCMVESEGWNRSSKIADFRKVSATAGEVVFHELVEPFQDLPTTINLGAEEAKPGRRSTQSQMTLQRLLVSPNVDLLRRGLQTITSRFDLEYPSISNLSPLISQGPDHFINKPMSDETGYNKQSPVGENAFSMLSETVTNTETPRRLKPLNLSYHAYAGEYPALLRSVKDQLSAAHLSTLTPVSANRYVAIVDGFLKASIDRVGDATWRIRDRGALQTVRFDAADSHEADLHSSVGVIGQKRDGSTLYVALDEATEPAIVVLKSSASPPTVSQGFALVESRWLIRHVVKDQCALRFEAQGYGAGSFTWAGASSDNYLIEVDRAEQELWLATAKADESGRLKFVLPLSAADPVTVRINCADTPRSAGQ